MNGLTFHGGRLSEAMALYGGGLPDWLDLSTGINPNPWPHADRLAIDWQRLPDEGRLAALEAAAAAYFDVDPAHICAVPGTEIGLRLLGTIIGGEARHVSPSYRTHGDMIAGSAPVAMDNLADAEGDIHILANPNNPDGRVIAPEQLLALIKPQGWLVVDEAFADADPRYSLASNVGEDRQLILFRSFGKFFGLAGVRIGFVLGPRAIIAAYRARLGAWPLPSAALEIGTAAYCNRDWIAAARDRLQQQRAALDELLRNHGYEPLGQCPLFCLIAQKDAAPLFERLAFSHILTRPFDYAIGWLRLGLPGNDAALARLDRALGDG